MRIAILSDIHGNLTAFKAVLNAIRAEKIDRTIFLGDYFGEFTKPNEVFDIIRNYENSVLVSGNKERYFEQDHFQDQKLWVYDHFQMIYWNHHEIKETHHDFIKTIPKKLAITVEGKDFLITHDSQDIFKSVVLKAFTSSNFAYLKPRSHNSFLNYVSSTLHKSPSFKKEIKRISSDIILFGHSHVQWHCFIGGKLIINPGSVGLPLDSKTGACYSILEIKNGKLSVEEKLVKYSMKRTIQALKNNDLYDSCRFWSDIAIDQLTTGKDTISFFFKYVSKVKEEFPNKSHWPLENELFEHAIKNWPEVKKDFLPY